MNFENLFAERMSVMKRSSIREILKLTARPEVISFAGGLPAPELFPTERFAEAAAKVITEQGQQALQYSPTEGMAELRELIAGRLSTPDFHIDPANVLMVTGSQQGLDLICRIFLNDSDKMVVENPTYLGMLMASRPYHPRYLPVETDDDGIVIDTLDDALEARPKMVYTVPNFQNPQGVTLSTERREQLIDRTYNRSLVVIEDNPYGELRYSGSDQPSLISMDAAKRGASGVEGNIIYLGTFSKILAPGLRIGWIVANDAIIDKLVQIKQSADLHSSTLTQYIAYEVSRDGFLESHIGKLREVYRQRRDVMLDALETYFPAEVTWRKPEGGLFLMVTLPEQVDAYDLLQRALEYDVAFVPGGDFHIGKSGWNTFRLNFSNAQPDMIVEGVKRLAALLKEELVTPAAAHK
ncbi:MAG: PLP-dependent aminotransferase family protein [Chloroflexi bacterium]|nr:PLP-dependent aminotransferase family protein [Chloroflexota bacterium]